MLATTRYLSLALERETMGCRFEDQETWLVARSTV
jgi:hypothetical protein